MLSFIKSKYLRVIVGSKIYLKCNTIMNKIVSQKPDASYLIHFNMIMIKVLWSEISPVE